MAGQAAAGDDAGRRALHAVRQDYRLDLHRDRGRQHFVLPGGGALDVHIDALSGRPGTEFTVSRSSRLAAIEDVQARMGIFERGRASA